MTTKIRTNNHIKKRIITIAIIVFAILSLLLGLLYIRAFNLIDYYGTQARCSSNHPVVVAMQGVLGSPDYYFPTGDSHNSGPYINGRYFCSNKEAEDAGYQLYTDLHVN